MTIQEQESIKKKNHALAVRYIANAKDALKKAGREGRYYQDSKYVSSASGIAYKGALVALETWLKLNGVELPKRNERGKAKGISIDLYRKHAAKRDRKLLQDINGVYDTLHLAGYYDSFRAINIIDSGFRIAERIIERIKPEGL